jgi:hypothetical protein
MSNRQRTIFKLSINYLAILTQYSATDKLLVGLFLENLNPELTNYSDLIFVILVL